MKNESVKETANEEKINGKRKKINRTEIQQRIEEK